MTNETIGDATHERNSEILDLFELWSEMLASGGAGRVTELYGPGAVLVPTLSNDLATDPDEIMAYFERLIRVYRPLATTLDCYNIHYFGDTAINSGIYTFDFANTGTRAQARYTFAYYWSNGGWLISAHHSSLLYRELVAGKASLEPCF